MFSLYVALDASLSMTLTCCALKRTKPDFQCQPMKKDHIIKCVFHGFQGMQHGNTWVLICL